MKAKRYGSKNKNNVVVDGERDSRCRVSVELAGLGKERKKLGCWWCMFDSKCMAGHSGSDNQQ